MREHRLYQADWLMRFYGFTHDEIVPPSQVGMLALDMDPKLAWALAHRERFPVNLNTAPRELLLRVPGFGVQTVERLLAARRVRRLRHADLARLHVPLKKVLPFVEAADYRPGRALDAARSWLRNWRRRRCNAACSETMQRHTITLDHPTDWPGFRTAARALVQADVPPQAVDWRCQADAAEDLFAPEAAQP